VVAGEEISGPYLAAIRRGFSFTGDLGCGCGPVHFLVGIAEGHGAPQPPWTLERGLPFARLSQSPAASAATAPAFSICRPRMARGRSRKLAARTWPLSTCSSPRPPLPVGDLDRRAWTALQWRQDHLPVSRARRRSDWDALSHLERKAAWRLTTRPALDDDQRYSLIWHHADQVEQRLASAKQDLSRPRPAPGRPTATLIPASRSRPRRPKALRFTVGWAAWLRNRRTGLHDRWFRLKTIRHYRRAPQS
jgi:hypothetical protein